MKEKSKNGSFRINRLSFFLLWVVLSAAISLFSNSIFYWLAEWLRQIIGETAFAENFTQIAMLAGLILGGLLAPIEKILLKMYWGQWVKGWMSSRLFGIFLSLLPYLLLQPFNLEYLVLNSSQNSVQIVLIAMLSALPQVLVLRRYVDHAWQYLFGVIISSLLPPFLIAIFVGTSLDAVFTLGASAAVMALTMLWLFAHPKSEEKAKNAQAESFSRLEDGADDSETEIENKAEEEKSTKRHSIISFVLYRFFKLNFWKTWQTS